MRVSIISSLLFAATVLASPVSHLARRQQATTCGSNYYSTDAVNAAFQQGYNYYQNGQTVGNDAYPHTYNDYEGFSFPVSGPYEEFPILDSGNVYTGGSPGADRVVFNTGGQYAGAITHTGASGNNFVGCSGTS